MRRRRLLLPAALAGVVLILMSCTLMGMAAMPSSPLVQRRAAEQRWQAQALTNYRLVVEVSITGRSCFQEIEVRGDWKSTLHDTCGSAWLSTLSVPRLFELVARLERPSECFPSTRTCVCQRVRVGTVEYDAESGLPGLIMWRRELRPNVQHPHYLTRLWELRELPNCSSPSRQLRLAVISLTPLPPSAERID